MMHSAGVFAMSYAPQGRQAPAPPAPPSTGELEQQVGEAIRAAQNAARDAQRAAENAQAQARAEGGDGGRIIRIGPGMQGGRGGGGFTSQRGGGFNDGGIPPQVAEISIAFFVMCAVMVIGWPIARAFGKRLERKGDTAVVAPAMTEQLQRIEQAVEAMSIEVERISESQRFIARLQNERLPQPADRS